MGFCDVHRDYPGNGPCPQCRQRSAKRARVERAVVPFVPPPQQQQATAPPPMLLASQVIVRPELLEGGVPPTPPPVLLPMEPAPQQAWHEAIVDDVFGNFGALLGRNPRRGPAARAPFRTGRNADPWCAYLEIEDPTLDVDHLRELYTVAKIVLEAANQDLPGNLNIVTGEQLLALTPQLSMMRVSSGYHPPFSITTLDRALPSSWVSDSSYLERVAQAQLSSVDSHALQVAMAHPRRVVFPTAKHKRNVMADVARHQHKIRGTFLDGLLSALDDETLASLAATSKRFLVVTALFTPKTMSHARAALLLKLAQTVLRLPDGEDVVRFGDDPNNALTWWTKPFDEITTYKGVRELVERFLGAGATIAGFVARRQFGIEFPCLGGLTTIINEPKESRPDSGAARVCFFHALSILREMNPNSTNVKVDLTYPKIAKFLDREGAVHAAEAFLQLLHGRHVDMPQFMAELAVLLIGVEGAQHQLNVLQAPMTVDLVAAGKCDWKTALMGKKPYLPLLPFCAEGSKKGRNPSSSFRDMLFGARLPNEDAGNFGRFVRAQLYLHGEFFQAFFPEVMDAEADPFDRQLLMILFMKHYLVQTFWSSPRSPSARAAGDAIDAYVVSLATAREQGSFDGRVRDLHG